MTKRRLLPIQHQGIAPEGQEDEQPHPEQNGPEHFQPFSLHVYGHFVLSGTAAICNRLFLISGITSLRRYANGAIHQTERQWWIVSRYEPHQTARQQGNPQDITPAVDCLSLRTPDGTPAVQSNRRNANGGNQDEGVLTIYLNSQRTLSGPSDWKSFRERVLYVRFRLYAPALFEALCALDESTASDWRLTQTIGPRSVTLKGGSKLQIRLTWDDNGPFGPASTI